MTEPLPADVADLLDAVLGADDPTHLALREQVAHLRVTERCRCGCGTASLEVDGAAGTPVPGLLETFVAVDVALFDESGDEVGGVLVFTQGGWLSLLEVYSWTDDKVTLAQARQMLRPAGPAAAHRGPGPAA
jgi:hypothetical protein